MSERAKNWIAFLVSTFLCLILIEFGLRLFEKESFYLPIRLDSDGFVRHTPNLDTYRLNNESKKKVHIVTNDMGFVGGPFVKEKTSGTLRIALLGDSFTEAMQVDYERTFGALLSRGVRDILPATSSYKEVEVYNFGIGGFGTVDELVYMEKFVRTYSPDIVLLMFYGGNDVPNNADYISRFEELRSLSADGIASVRLHGSEGLSGLAGWKNRLYRNSAIIRLCDRVVRSAPFLQRLAVRAGLFRQRSEQKTVSSIEPFHAYYTTSSVKGVAEAYDFTDWLLQRMQESASSFGAKFVVGYIPEGRMVSSTLAASIRDMYIREGFDTFYPEAVRDRIFSSAQKAGILWCDLTGSLASAVASSGESVYIEDRHHFSEAGHGVAVKYLSSCLIQ